MNVLFISKPIAAPFHDGSKCLVRDIATRLERAHPVLLSTADAAPIQPVANPVGGIQMVPIYSNAGTHAPSQRENLRAALWVLLRSRADIWHFVFAPNPRTSLVGNVLRRGRRRPCVQTIASPPRSFDGVSRLLFGDVVVAQSRWTLERVRAACEREGCPPPELCVIPPPVSVHITRTAEEQAAARASLGIPLDAPLFIYPGDLEVSSGGRVALQIAEGLAQKLPSAITLLAYRRKTSSSDSAAEALRRDAPSNVRFAATVPDVLALVASASAILFPVDDLWGKVDLPIVLLEAMVLGVPVLVLGEGPLSELTGAEIIQSLEPEAWLSAALRLASDGPARSERLAAQRAGIIARADAEQVARAYEALYFDVWRRRLER